MPLVRFEVRNEYGLGQAELYKEANREDPKAVLDGVAVAGLVGILRQLGDLAEFAAEVFHGLQEQVMTTASRSHKLMVRVQKIEASLPSLEKAVLAQTSHIHFAYTAGFEWHPHIENEQNHFIYNDLPRFIMDSYEECRDPPRLHLLDKFDTGGPGSCLKRYSDPTFFRRVAGNCRESDSEKVQKDKRANKSKKKRSSHRNGDLLHSASMTNHSGRMQFTTPIVNGRNSPSHMASSIDMTLKSDLGDHSNSSDSRTGSGYAECVFHLSSSAQPDEPEFKELSSGFVQHNDIPNAIYPNGQPGVADVFHLSSSAQPDEPEFKEFSSGFVQHNDIPNSIYPNGQPGIADDNFPHGSSPEQIAYSSSCVTWDVKTEILESKDHHCDKYDASDILTTDSDLDTQDRRIANLRNPDQIDVVSDDENTVKPSSSMNELDEVESEPGNYMDALNTIESESENDLDCQMKHEVEQLSPLNIEGIEDGTNEVTTHISDHYSLKYESHTASDISSNKEIPCDLPNSVPPESLAGEQTFQISGKLSDSDCSPGIEGSTSADALDGSKVESVSDPSSSGSGISNLPEPLSGTTVSRSCKSQESQAELIHVPSISFWTNGGLLGLEPSKPPDFSVSRNATQDSAITGKDEAVGPPDHTLKPSNDGDRGKPGRLVKGAESMERILSSKCSTSWHEDQDGKADKYGVSHHSDRFNDASVAGSNITMAVAAGTGLPPDANIKATSVETGLENDNSSQIFGLGHRLLINGFRRKMSHVSDEPANSLKTGELELKNGHHGVTYPGTLDKASRGQVGHKLMVDSLRSSPPLEHMKISFHPIDGFEASKLKLKFPDGSHSNQNNRDMFPSFQLVPEPAILLHDMGSDSDDDTFCRSSPYMSDDCLSHHSELDSEKWESGVSPESRDHELYDALCRLSSVESVSSSLQPGETGNNGICIDTGLQNVYTENGADPTLSASLLDLPSFDYVNPVREEEAKDNLDPRSILEAQYPLQSTSLPPPLPPVQWRISKPLSDIEKDKQHAISEAQQHAFDLKLLGPTTIPLQHKPGPTNEQQTNEESVAFKPNSKEQDQQKLKLQKEGNQPANGLGMDEKEDFLHQIRAKSFTLRRTVTAKSTFAPGPTANDKVTAILEKANAIRQAVASDDGEEDDSWSDT